MPYTAFQTYFPEIAEKETRCLQIFNDPALAGDNFILLELFCDEPQCDCRRVMLNILSERRKASVGVINFGWESEKFYENWFGSYDKDIIYDLKGPSINIFSTTTEITDKIFKHVKNALQDKFFVNRIIQHYVIFREYIENLADNDPSQKFIKTKSIGRNELCPCGSGKKFKNCCLLNS